MKLRIKETGEIVELVGEFKRSVDKPDFTLDTYETLAELCEAVEDYEEPKEFWYILSNGGIIEKEITTDELRQEFITDAKEVGNYFETEEEAKKAVEKVKAWQRLKEKGFRFKGYYLGLDGNFSIKFETGIKCDIKDLDLLFGGEE